MNFRGSFLVFVGQKDKTGLIALRKMDCLVIKLLIWLSPNKLNDMGGLSLFIKDIERFSCELRKVKIKF